MRLNSSAGPQCSKLLVLLFSLAIPPLAKRVTEVLKYLLGLCFSEELLQLLIFADLLHISVAFTESLCLERFTTDPIPAFRKLFGN